MIGVSAASPSSCCLPRAWCCLAPSSFTALPILIPASKKSAGYCGGPYTSCCAAKHQQQHAGPSKKKGGRRKAPDRPLEDDVGDTVEMVPGPQNRRTHPSPLPKPPAGFVLDEHGRVLLASSKRITTIPLSHIS